MELISGYEAKDLDKFIEVIKGIWEKQGKKVKGASERYEIIIGKVSQRAAFRPTVSTRAGTETIIIWNLKHDNIKKIEEEAKTAGIPVSSRPYVWFDYPPTVLPNESQEG